jgi:hypothetical protein
MAQSFDQCGGEFQDKALVHSMQGDLGRGREYVAKEGIGSEDPQVLAEGTNLPPITGEQAKSLCARFLPGALPGLCVLGGVE